MGVYLKQFTTHAEYDAYINGSGAILPNVSICTTEGDVHYNPYVSPYAGFCKLVLSNGETVELEGSGRLTSAHTREYSATTVNAEIGTQCTSIGERTFFQCTSLTSCTIGSGVTSIGTYAFHKCSGLTSIEIPSGVTTIGINAFGSCSGLTNIVIPNSVTSIGEGAFGYCTSLTNIVIPNSVTTIGDSIFNNCTSLTSCTIGSGVTSIGTYTFNKCSSLTSIVCNATTSPTISSTTFRDVKTRGTLTVPSGSSGYDVWMGTSGYYLGYYNWTKVEQ